MPQDISEIMISKWDIGNLNLIHGQYINNMFQNNLYLNIDDILTHISITPRNKIEIFLSFSPGNIIKRWSERVIRRHIKTYLLNYNNDTISSWAKDWLEGERNTEKKVLDKIAYSAVNASRPDNTYVSKIVHCVNIINSPNFLSKGKFSISRHLSNAARWAYAEKYKYSTDAQLQDIEVAEMYSQILDASLAIYKDAEKEKK